ncbi:hypothetical protein CL6EHI_180400 [Entamoeba histolytica]|uniref:Uncharacterized protein n=4 Tax=Entamoeba histolytica TaxID=5759 RepID=C4M289_ENTH1|nr:hypothetical protein EHI_180400 [Entamoeba histolytica HM-1:IMSS]EAL48432.1 hypothetical protein EHI_180400 [Entamoeba histolytica HM-1:IMSS]ENY61062.1 hypothetical protein EHI7A_113340 [Entamoeba histolytica HM-1:IMSS-A]GAT95385.1 hypothetical protein CL6EHI_180400 [Entamoeba histolytica]|eukprot:XP_653818.1 hypothetical protein EHI_180400 [Entamoeba histolytica HM-1:IMSS]
MIYFIFLFITVSFSKQCYEYTGSQIDTVDGAFECIESLDTLPEQNKEIINGLKVRLEAYVFKDILKNPPQPSFSNNYYEKVDVDAELDKINTDTISFYDFYFQIKKLIVSTRDMHLRFYVNDELSDNWNKDLLYFYYFLPFNITIDRNKKMYLIPKDVFKGVSVDVPQKIIDNKDVAIKTINGEDPFNIIREFGKEYIGLKCPHAQFTLAKSTESDYALTQGRLTSQPLPKNYLNKQIYIEWENGQSDNVNYSILRHNSRYKENTKQIENNNEEESLKSINRTIESTENEELKNEYGSLVEPIYCRVSDKKVNTFVLKEFISMDSLSRYNEIVLNCIKLFDSNEYPIQVILPENAGGEGRSEQWIEKIFAPHNDVRMIVSARISTCTEAMLKTGIEGDILSDPKTCNKRGNLFDEKELKKCIGVNQEGFLNKIVWFFKSVICRFKLYPWYLKPKTIKYGDVEHIITQPSIEVFQENKLMKNPRKPTEIVVYTDSYCYSACSILTKGLKEWGSAILVGFNGDPNGKDEEFEVGQSPTGVDDIDGLCGSEYSIFKYGYSLSLSFLESFRYNYNYDETIPREFLTDMIDERVNIYQYSNNNLEEFEEETLKIVDKYKIKCNPKNKRLVKVDSNCDKEIKVEHGHGGYECGDNGEWSTKCIVSYCDDGYKFDYNNNKCVEDICVNPPNPSNGTPQMTVNIFMILIGVMAFL